MSRAFAVITGNVTRDPEAGTLPGTDTPTSRFDIAVDDKVKGQKVTTFFRVNLVGQPAKVANEFLVKGRETQVEGTVRLSTFTRNNGEAGASIEVRGTALNLLRGEGRAEAAGAGSSSSAAAPTADVDDSDIPF
jgi:single stranded DNA-binding protein